MDLGLCHPSGTENLGGVASRFLKNLWTSDLLFVLVKPYECDGQLFGHRRIV
jgi:hypothetical protein